MEYKRLKNHCLEPVYHVVSVETFENPVYVVEEQPGLKERIDNQLEADSSIGVIEVINRKRWAEMFI